MFEGDSADMCAGKFPLVWMGGRAEGLACADPGTRTPIGAGGNYLVLVTLTIVGGVLLVIRSISDKIKIDNTMFIDEYHIDQQRMKSNYQRRKADRVTSASH